MADGAVPGRGIGLTPAARRLYCGIEIGFKPGGVGLDGGSARQEGGDAHVTDPDPNAHSSGSGRRARPDGIPVAAETGPLRLRIAHVAAANSVMTASDGDLWPSAWGSDGALYAAAGDGTGFARHG